MSNNIWYATEKRARSINKLLTYDDVGALKYSDTNISFEGRKTKIVIEGIKEITFTRQRLNWGTYALLNLVMIALYFPVIQREGLASLQSGIALLLLCNALGMMIGINTRWIRVEWRDAAGNAEAAYFALAGWNGIGGGTRSLKDRIVEWSKGTHKKI